MWILLTNINNPFFYALKIWLKGILLVFLVSFSLSLWNTVFVRDRFFLDRLRLAVAMQV